MISPSSQRVVVAAMDATDADTAALILRVVDLLRRPGRQIDVALIGDGAHLRTIRRNTSVTVADHYRTRGLGRLATLVGQGGWASRYKAFRVHHWMRRARTARWILLDPRAASFLRHSTPTPVIVLAAVADSGLSIHELSPLDLETLAGAAMWLASTERQRDDLQFAGRQVRLLSEVYERSANYRLPAQSAGGGPVVLSTPSHRWLSVDHTVELVAQIHQAHPTIPLVWLVDDGEDAWLARHDLDHLGLKADALAQVVIRSPLETLRPRLVIRTGYQTSDAALVSAAACAAIPTIGFEVSDLPPVSGTHLEPFNVEGLVDLTTELLDDSRRQTLGAELREAMNHRLRTQIELSQLLDPKAADR